MKVRVLVTVVALLLAIPAFAHEVQKGPNGGRIADAGEFHIEVVAKADAIDVFVSDAADKPVVSTGFKGVAILLIGGKQQRIPLEATTPDRLSGKTPANTAATVQGVVQLTTPKGGSVQARFK